MLQLGLGRAITSASMLVPSAALAHPGHGGDIGFAHDLEHLLAGLDPALAIVLSCAAGLALGFGVVARRGRSSSLRP
jgi:hydrogenase/urease accessory protein HupE